MGGAWKQSAYFSYCPLYSPMVVLDSNGLANQSVARGGDGCVARVAMDLVASDGMGRISLYHGIDSDGSALVVGLAGSRGIAAAHYGHRSRDDRRRGLFVHWS